MISSRWPRPIGISASIALMPVWTGVSTLLRLMTPGAMRSTGRLPLAAIGPLSSSGTPSGFDDAADERLADRHLDHAAGGLDLVAFLDLLVVAQDDRADRLLLEVEGHAHHAAGELEQLRCQRARQTVDLGDAVADLDHGADRACLDAGIELVDGRLQDGRDVFGSDGHRLLPGCWRSERLGICHGVSAPLSRRERRRSRRPRTLPSMSRSPTRS